MLSLTLNEQYVHIDSFGQRVLIKHLYDAYQSQCHLRNLLGVVVDQGHHLGNEYLFYQNLPSTICVFITPFTIFLLMP